PESCPAAPDGLGLRRSQRTYLSSRSRSWHRSFLGCGDQERTADTATTAIHTTRRRTIPGRQRVGKIRSGSGNRRARSSRRAGNADLHDLTIGAGAPAAQRGYLPVPRNPGPSRPRRGCTRNQVHCILAVAAARILAASAWSRGLGKNASVRVHLATLLTRYVTSEPFERGGAPVSAGMSSP